MKGPYIYIYIWENVRKVPHLPFLFDNNLFATFILDNSLSY